MQHPLPTAQQNDGDRCSKATCRQMALLLANNTPWSEGSLGPAWITPFNLTPTCGSHAWPTEPEDRER